jgi:ribosomal RNA-processing protein 9
MRIDDSVRSICLWTTQRKKPIFTHAVAHGFTETISETEGVIRTPRWITSLGTLRYSDLFASGKRALGDVVAEP